MKGNGNTLIYDFMNAKLNICRQAIAKSFWGINRVFFIAALVLQASKASIQSIADGGFQDSTFGSGFNLHSGNDSAAN